jgi:hypothetical protein
MKPRWSAKFAESRWDSRVLFEIADFGFVIKKISVIRGIRAQKALQRNQFHL